MYVFAFHKSERLVGIFAAKNWNQVKFFVFSRLSLYFVLFCLVSCEAMRRFVCISVVAVASHVAWAKRNCSVSFDCTLLRHVRLLLVRRTWEPAVTHTHTQHTPRHSHSWSIIIHFLSNFIRYTKLINEWQWLKVTSRHLMVLLFFHLLLLLQIIQHMSVCVCSNGFVCFFYISHLPSMMRTEKSNHFN